LSIRNCSEDSNIYLDNNIHITYPAAFPLGTTDVTWTATRGSETATDVQHITLVDTSGNYATATESITVKYAKISNGIVGDDVEAVSAAAATTGNLFRYDLTSNQYIFNLGTLQEELIKKTSNKLNYDAIANEILRLRDQKEKSEINSHSRE